MVKKVLPVMLMAFFAMAVFGHIPELPAKADFFVGVQAAMWAGLRHLPFLPVNLLVGAGAAAAVYRLEVREAKRKK